MPEGTEIKNSAQVSEAAGQTAAKAPAKNIKPSPKKAAKKAPAKNIKPSPKKAAKKAPATKCAAKKAVKGAKAKASGGGPGRVSQFSGKRLHKLVKDNPRREGTAGHKSWSVITSGMSYEKFRELGGRNIDLTWEVNKGNIELR